MQLSVENLSQSRGGRMIFNHLTFHVLGGEALLLTGTNGSGKTTLIRTIAGLMKPLSGSISLSGGEAERTLAEQCHFVGHLNGLKSNLTVGENLAFWAGYLNDTASTANAHNSDALAQFGVEGLINIPAGYLSAGQKRRVALSRLIAVERPLWLLDEPTSSLDSEAAGRLTAAVTRHVKAGGLAIAATHLPLDLPGAREIRLGTNAEAA